MKFLMFFLFISLKVNATEETNLFKIIQRSPEMPDKIVEISPSFTNQEIDSNHHKWNMDPKKYRALVKEWLALPGSVDQMKTCPRDYLKFELRNGKIKRTELICNDNTTSTRRRYLDFAKKIL